MIISSITPNPINFNTISKLLWNWKCLVLWWLWLLLRNIFVLKSLFCENINKFKDIMICLIYRQWVNGCVYYLFVTLCIIYFLLIFVLFAILYWNILFVLVINQMVSRLANFRSNILLSISTINRDININVLKFMYPALNFIRFMIRFLCSEALSFISA